MNLQADQSNPSEMTPEELSQEAIKAALSSSWEKALKLNEEILKVSPNDIEASNRLARAYLECGKVALAKKIWRQVLSLDPYNVIARKNLKRVTRAKGLSFLPKNDDLNATGNIQIFLEEPGKSKTVCLVKLATPQVLSTLSAGYRVNFVPKKHGISVCCGNNCYIGALPDDIAHHLLNLISGGNRYEAFIKGINSANVYVLIREVHRAPRFLDQPSFLPEEKGSDYYPYVREEALKTNSTIEPDGDDLTPEEKEEHEERSLPYQQPTPAISVDDLSRAEEI